ncbi:MAG TPA: addiction module protein [Verrucomicrobiae bacterium]|nr:addiction module protein [Verrucomicrobiae bacterium]
MSITLPLADMTTAEKLDVMEALWKDLSRDESKLPSPGWHRDVLEKREARRQAGEETPIEWEAAKRELRSRLR